MNGREWTAGTRAGADRLGYTDDNGNLLKGGWLLKRRAKGCPWDNAACELPPLVVVAKLLALA